MAEDKNPLDLGSLATGGTQEELNDEQLDEVSGGGRFGPIIEHKPQ